MVPMWKGSKLTSMLKGSSRLTMLPYKKVQSYPRCLMKGSKLSTLLSSLRLTSVYFHHVVGISINYRRGENSTTWRFSTETLCTLALEL